MTDRTFHKHFGIPAKCGVTLVALLAGYFFWIKAALVGILLALVAVGMIDRILNTTYTIRRIKPADGEEEQDFVVIDEGKFSRKKWIPLHDVARADIEPSWMKIEKIVVLEMENKRLLVVAPDNQADFLRILRSRMAHLATVLLALLALSQPAMGQEVIEETDETEAADTAMVDSVALEPDTLVADTLPWPQAISRGIDRLLESKMFETSQVGIMVWDLQADSCIYRHRECQLMRPASTMKLLTAITALDKLGGSYQFKTQLKYTGKVEDGVLVGDIYCIGGMDPRFNTDDMTAFVTSLKDMGVDSIRGHIYADRSMKDKDLLGEGWCWDDDNPVLSPLVYGRKDNFMERFLVKLANAGIYYQGDSAVARSCPAGAFSVCTRFHTMDQILHKMMKESDNLYAESMYYQIAASTGNRPASAKSAQSVERQLIRKVGLDPKRYRLADGSGLSLYNYLSAELEVRILRYAYQNENILPHLKQSLPIAGEDGTLKKRMKSGFAHDNVKAKTGTLTGIISLAGYCKAANGHDLCFAIINNGIMHGDNARNFADKVCEMMCKP